jgi:hypothetical protein
VVRLQAGFFGACMLKVGNLLGYLGDASLYTWEPALTRLASHGYLVRARRSSRAPYCRRMLTIFFPLASSSISLSR